MGGLTRSAGGLACVAPPREGGYEVGILALTIAGHHHPAMRVVARAIVAIRQFSYRTSSLWEQHWPGGRLLSSSRSRRSFPERRRDRRGDSSSIKGAAGDQLRSMGTGQGLEGQHSADPRRDYAATRTDLGFDAGFSRPGDGDRLFDRSFRRVPPRRRANALRPLSAEDQE